MIRLVGKTPPRPAGKQQCASALRVPQLEEEEEKEEHFFLTSQIAPCPQWEAVTGAPMESGQCEQQEAVPGTSMGHEGE